MGFWALARRLPPRPLPGVTVDSASLFTLKSVALPCAVLYPSTEAHCAFRYPEPVDMMARLIVEDTAADYPWKERNVSERAATAGRLLSTGFGILGIGLLLALATDMGLTLLSSVKCAFILGGFALLIPTMVVKDPKAYWLFLLVLSIPFDISKWLSAWMVDPQSLVDQYGQPASGTVSLELYLTDVVLIAMLLPWLTRVCIRRESLYFPKIGYLFLLYLAWALPVSLINADSLFLSFFELCRQALYLLFFVYLINNVATRGQFRSIVCAVFFGLAISAGSVIAFFEMGIGTETAIFASLHDQQGTSGNSQASRPGENNPGVEDLTLHGDSRRFPGSTDPAASALKRSQGMFRHPAIPASLFGLTLPIVLAYLLVARTNRDRILFSTMILVGVTGLVLTFSRAGAISLMVGTVVLFAVGGWSGLVSRRLLTLCGITFILAAALSVPLMLIYFGARPGSFLMRFYLFEAALRGYAEHPILGVGLNNGTAAMKAGREAFKEIGIPIPPTELADSLYLATLAEVGPIGFMLFFGFFAQVVMLALRTIKDVTSELQPLLVGIIAGLASLATQCLADDPLAGHAVSGTMWLFAGLIVAAARSVRKETQLFPADAAPMSSRFGPAI